MDISICLRIDKLIEEMNGYCPHSNHWIYFTSSGYLSRGVTYDNQELGIYKVEYLYEVKNSWEETIAVATTITKGEPRLIPIFRF